jgi:uncharacterized membrane protein
MLGVFIVLYFIAGLIIGIGAGADSGIIASLGGLIYMVVAIGLLACIIIGAIKAYQGQLFKLPIIGDMADKWSN